jgi:Flp pilus assembly protein TadD
LENGTAILPSFSLIQGNLGVLLFFQGNYNDAISPLRAALKLQPALWKIEALLGMAEKRYRRFRQCSCTSGESLP